MSPFLCTHTYTHCAEDGYQPETAVHSCTCILDVHSIMCNISLLSKVWLWISRGLIALILTHGTAATEGGREGRLVVGGRERNEGKDVASSYTCTCMHARAHTAAVEGGRERGREGSFIQVGRHHNEMVCRTHQEVLVGVDQ